MIAGVNRSMEQKFVFWKKHEKWQIKFDDIKVLNLKFSTFNFFEWSYQNIQSHAFVSSKRKRKTDSWHQCSKGLNMSEILSPFMARN